MSVELTATILLAVAALLVAWHASLMVLVSAPWALLVVAPLALAIPWTGGAGAVGDAASLSAALLLLGGWIHLRSPVGRARTGLVMGVAAVAIRPETVLAALAAVLVDSLVFERPRRVGRAFGAGGIIAFAALAAGVVIAFVQSGKVTASPLVEGVSTGVAWQSARWVFTDDTALRVISASRIYDAYFYWPMLVVFALFALWMRRCWWAGPLLAWAAIVILLTLWLVPQPGIHTCLPLQAALVMPFGVVGAAALRTHLHSKDSGARQDPCRP